MATWHTLDSARAEWVDAPLDDTHLSNLLEVAKDAVLAYAPTPTYLNPDPVTITGDDYTLALARTGVYVNGTIIAQRPLVGSIVPGTVPAEFVPSGYPKFVTPDGVVILEFSWGSGLGDYTLTTGPWDPIEGDPRTVEVIWSTSAEVQGIPVAWRVAQLMQARNVWNSSQASPNGGDGFDSIGYGLTTTHPLDWQIKQLLRPRSVFGGVVG